MTEQQQPSQAPADVATQLGERIHLLMWRARITQAQMAAGIGVGQSTLSKKLRGQVPMTVTELMTIAGLLGVQPGDLLPRLDSNQQPSGYLQQLLDDVHAQRETPPAGGGGLWVVRDDDE